MTYGRVSPVGSESSSRWTTKKVLKVVFAVTFVLCFIGTVVGLPLMAKFANGGNETEDTSPKETSTTGKPVEPTVTTEAQTSTAFTTNPTTSATTSKSSSITTSKSTTSTSATTLSSQSTSTTLTTKKTTQETTTSETSTTIEDVTTTSFTTTTTTTTTTKTIPDSGWRQWTDWSDCSVTCGSGESVRSRECVVFEGDQGPSIECPGYTGNIIEFETYACSEPNCISGYSIVEETTNLANEKGVEHNLFLNRYAESVTDNGNTVNANDSTSIGYGIWRVTEDQFQEMLTTSKSKKTVTDISSSLIANVNFVCGSNHPLDINVQRALELADADPCFSMMALTTLLFNKNKYPLPLSMDLQEQILGEISDQQVKEWSLVVDEELDKIKTECLQADIDFEFVIDSSGSVGIDNWELTMELIGEAWIKKVIIPNGSKQCGNHVAGRWFATNTQRFFDFEPPAKNVYAPKSYPDYVGDRFINQAYNSGGTNTAEALRQTRVIDLPMARNGLKYVMVFTDGQSNSFSATSSEAQQLHSVADRTYAFGIGTGIDMNELNAIASDPAFVGRMTSFADLEAYVRLFIVQQLGCKTPIKQAHRAVDLRNMKSIGMSHLTARDLTSEVDPQCESSSTCAAEPEANRQSVCSTCSNEIAQLHKPLLQQIYANVEEASSSVCFPPEIALALISRLSIKDSQFIQSPTNDGWRPCLLKHHWYEQCYGLMHIPASKNPNTDNAEDSIEHFVEGIYEIIELTSLIAQSFESFSATQQTRGGLAAYDAGVAAVEAKNAIDKMTTNGDFSADILSRAKEIETIIY